MNKKTRIFALFLSILALFSLFTACNTAAPVTPAVPETTPAPLILLTDPPEAAAPLQTVAPDETPAPTPEPTEAPTPAPTEAPTPEPTATPLPEDGEYDDKDSVALYIHTYGKLPPNYISKKTADKLGWPGGGLDNYAYGKCIGGDRYGNYSGDLPSAKGRSYHECDIGTMHKRSRGAKRIIYSSDGLIFYTDDHYETFTQLY